MIRSRPRRPASLQWVQAIREPHQALDWTIAEWERVVRLSRRLRLLARLAESLIGADLILRVPPEVRRHLLAEQRMSRWRIGAILWTIERVASMLGDAPYPRVLLKGAAYLAQDLPIAAGRLPSDLDILVPREHVPDAQARLSRGGWNVENQDDYHKRYYEELSHEVQPMTHPLLYVELDLHYNIAPPVSRVRVDIDALLQNLRPSKWLGWQVLDPVDQVLHSATHLFQDSEARDRLRDLVDLDGLLRHFGESPEFWDRLPQRARDLGLVEPLALACHFVVSWLGTPIPEATLAAVESIGPSSLRRAWLLPLWARVLTPTEPDQVPGPAQGIADFVLLARYHRNRMPLHLLVPHIWHKLRLARAGAADK